MPKPILLFCLLLIGAYPLRAQLPKERLERLMDYYAAHDRFNGTALITRHGAVLLAKSYGYSDARNKIKNTDNTIYQLGTNTEQFTAEVILQLDSKGRLGLEDRINKYFPDYPHGDRISIKNLLTHTSGIYNYCRDTLLSVVHADKARTRDAILALFKNQPLAFAAGSRSEYSAANYFLLGLIIEQITHKKYEAEVRENILHVCGMSRTGFDLVHLREADKASGYRLSGADHFTEAIATDSSLLFAGGEMYSAAGDLLKWHRALVHHRLLPKDWQDLAYAPFRNDVALGWNIVTKFNKHFMQRAGSLTGFSNYEVREEDDDLFIVLLENCKRGGAPDEEIANNLVQLLYDKNYQLPGERRIPAAATAASAPAATASHPKGRPVSLDVLKKYVGEFEINPAFTLSFSIHGNELVAASPDNKFIEMISETETLFRTVGLNAEIEFVKDSHGKVNKIVLHQQGQLIPGVRSK